MPPKRILLVDDDEFFVASIRAILESNGYAVDVAGDGQEGLRKISESPPDLVVLDVMMTTLSEGFDVARKLKAEAATRTLPILMLTAVSQRFNMPFSPEEEWLPVDRFLEKPVEPEALLREVGALLGA